jgi:transposase
MNTQQQTRTEISIERLDDIPLLIALQQRIGLDNIIDEVIERHWFHQGVSIGQLVVGWNAYILSESDHRKVAVEDWAIDHQLILSDLLGTPLRRTDFTDDRLGQVLSHLADDAAWREIETRLWQQTVSVYRLTPERVRLDATRFSGYHTPTDDGMMQRGYHPNAPSLAQVKLMAASIDCGTSGHLVATQVVSGEKADDPLYLPVIGQIRQMFGESGLLYIGDSKMSAIEIRAELARGGDFYLVPLAKVGEVLKLYDQCVKDIVEGSQTATLIYNADGQTQQPELIAAGYQMTRTQKATLPKGEEYTWAERILVVRSLAEAKKQFADLEQRITQATQALWALTPDPGRGHRQIRTKAKLIENAQGILAAYDVKDYLRYTLQRDPSVKTRYIGPGRGSPNRKTRQIRTVRYQITAVIRDEAAIMAAFCGMGWQLYATNLPEADLPIDEAVRLYRAAPRIERHFHLFKDAPIGISPMYVRNDDQIKGLVRLLSLCVRLLTLIEIVTRRHLAQQKGMLAGLYEGNPNRKTDAPTAVRILRAFRGMSRVRFLAKNKDSPYTTPLSARQRQILSMLGISEGIYQTSGSDSNVLSTFGRRCGEFLARISHTFNRVLNRR